MNAGGLAAVALTCAASVVSAQSPPPNSASSRTALTATKQTVPDRAVLLKQAGDAQRAGRLDEAMRLFRLAGEKHRSVQALLELARLQSRSKQPAEALTTLTKARELAPNSEDVLSAYAQLALAVKQPMPAVLTLDVLTRMCASVAQYHYLLGVGLMAIGDMPGAVDALVQADRLEPDRALTLLALGLGLNNRKQYAEAQTVLARSVELQPDSLEAVAALAEAQAGLGDFDGAARNAQRALDRMPGGATANLVLGLVAMERRDYAEARDALLKAAAGDPDSPKATYQLSLVYARLGDDVSSKRYLEIYQANLKRVEHRIKTLRAGGSLADAKVRQ
jgi:tetratricopeptide (TPR) repeat protein